MMLKKIDNEQIIHDFGNILEEKYEKYRRVKKTLFYHIIDNNLNVIQYQHFSELENKLINFTCHKSVEFDDVKNI